MQCYKSGTTVYGFRLSLDFCNPKLSLTFNLGWSRIILRDTTHYVSVGWPRPFMLRASVLWQSDITSLHCLYWLEDA
jgi:hypothetical protein